MCGSCQGIKAANWSLFYCLYQSTNRNWCALFAMECENHQSTCKVAETSPNSDEKITHPLEIVTLMRQLANDSSLPYVLPACLLTASSKTYMIVRSQGQAVSHPPSWPHDCLSLPYSNIALLCVIPSLAIYSRLFKAFFPCWYLVSSYNLMAFLLVLWQTGDPWCMIIIINIVSVKINLLVK